MAGRGDVHRRDRRRAGAAGRRRPRTAPAIDGARLDDIVDYVTYVLVPGVLVWRLDLLPPAAAPWVVGATLVASALGFARRDAKTDDHLFTGFPSYWNVVAVYLIALRPPPPVAAAILLLLAVLVFVPIRYVYPSRTVDLASADGGARRAVGDRVRRADLAAARSAGLAGVGVV